MPNLVLLDRVGSTQDEMLIRLRLGERLDGVAASSQTAARGRHGRVWLSPLGESLSISLAVRAPHSAGAAPFTGMAAAARIAAHYGAKVRWPNDVVIDDKKVAGILVEATEIGGTRWLIVGIGVNLRQEVFPASIADRATSLRLAKGIDLDWREEAEIVAEIALRPAPESWREIEAEWRVVDATPGKIFRSPGQEPLKALGVDDAGQLRLDSPEGVRTVAAADAYFGREAA